MSAGARLGREAGWIAFGQGLSALGGLFAVKVLTRSYSPDVYGNAWLVINGILLAVGLTARPLAEALSRYFHDAGGQDRLDRLLALIWRLQLGTAVIAGGLYLLVAYSASALAGPAWISFAILPVYFFGSSLFSTAELLLNTSRRRRARTLLTVTEAWLRPGLALLIGALWRNDLNAFVLGYAAGDIIAGTLGAWTTKGFGSAVPWRLPAPDRAMVRDVLGYALPWTILLMCGWTMACADRYLLKAMRPGADVGAYVAAYQVGSAPFQVLNVLFGSLFQPFLFRHAAISKSAAEEGMGAAFKLFLWAGLPGLAAFFVLRDWLMHLLTDPDYWAGAAALPWIGLGTFFLIVGDQARNAFLIAKNTRAFLRINVMAALGSILLNLVLIGPLGMVGAGVACAITFALYAAGAVYWGRQLVSWAFPSRTLLWVGLASTAAAGCSMGLHQWVLQGRYDWLSGLAVAGVFLGVLAAGLWWRRHEVVQAVRPLAALET